MTDDARPKSRAKCGICGKPVVSDFRPFCSARCKQIDLGRWLNESYRVPEVEQDEDASDEDNSGSN